MMSRSKRLRAPVAIAAAVALVVMSPGTVSAEESGPVDRFFSELKERHQDRTSEGADSAGSTDDATGSGGTGTRVSTQSSPPPEPESDDDLPGNETEDPAPPDHGAAEVADADLAGEDVADVGHNDATVEDDDSTSADSTLLALGGEEIIGAHADSDGAGEGHFGDFLAPLCEGSEGQLCLRLLYADAWASDDGGTSSSTSQNGVLGACVGGTTTDPAAECDGPVRAGVVESSADAERDQASGRTTASSEAYLADICLAADPNAEGCDVGLEVLTSKGSSDSGGAGADADRGSKVVGLQLGGEELVALGDPQSLTVPPGCEEPGLLCVFTNQGETYVGEGIAGHAQEAVKALLLSGTPLEVSAGVGRTETLVHNDGGEAADGQDDAGDEGAGDDEVLGSGGGPGAPGSDVAGVSGLPNTGGFWSGLLGLAFLATAGGAFLIALSRRRTVLPT